MYAQFFFVNIMQLSYPSAMMALADASSQASEQQRLRRRELRRKFQRLLSPPAETIVLLDER